MIIAAVVFPLPLFLSVVYMEHVSVPYGARLCTLWSIALYPYGALLYNIWSIAP